MTGERKADTERKTKDELKEEVSRARKLTPYGSHWRHKKSRKVYTCNGVILSSDTAKALTIYTNNGLVWARDTDEFLTRFETL